MDFKEFFEAAGPAMYFNVFISAVSIAVMGERFYAVFFRLRVPEKAFLEQVEKQLVAGKVDRAIQICASYPDAALPQVIKAALQQANHGGAAITGAIDEALLEVSPKISKRISALWSLANIATLVGLIGTIFGLIQAFGATALIAPDQKAAALSKGISEAMYNTAMGLTIAVACIIAHLLLTTSTRGMMENIEHSSARIENLLARARSQARRGQYESA